MSRGSASVRGETRDKMDEQINEHLLDQSVAINGEYRDILHRAKRLPYDVVIVVTALVIMVVVVTVAL